MPIPITAKSTHAWNLITQKPYSVVYSICMQRRYIINDFCDINLDNPPIFGLAHSDSWPYTLWSYKSSCEHGAFSSAPVPTGSNQLLQGPNR